MTKLLKSMFNIQDGLKKILDLILIPARSILGDNLIDYLVKPINEYIDELDDKIKALNHKIDNYKKLYKLKNFIIQNDKDGKLLGKFLPRLADIKIIPGKNNELISLREQINLYLNERKNKYPNARVSFDRTSTDMTPETSTYTAAQPPSPPATTAASAATKAETTASLAVQNLPSPMSVGQMSQMPMTPIDPKQMNMMTQQMFMMMMMDYMQNMSNRNKSKKRFGFF